MVVKITMDDRSRLTAEVGQGLTVNELFQCVFYMPGCLLRHNRYLQPLVITTSWPLGEQLSMSNRGVSILPFFIHDPYDRLDTTATIDSRGCTNGNNDQCIGRKKHLVLRIYVSLWSHIYF